jgi:hypothetical protein
MADASQKDIARGFGSFMMAAGMVSWRSTSASA